MKFYSEESQPLKNKKKSKKKRKREKKARDKLDKNELVGLRE